MPKLRDYRWFQENYPVDIPEMDISPESMEIDMPSGAGYIGTPPTGPEDTALIGQLTTGKPAAFFGDPEGRAEYEALGAEEESLGAERKGIQAEVEKLTPEQRAYYEKRLARGKPPEGYQVPDFSDAGRHRYEQGVFRQIEEIWKIPGGNPYNINALDAVDEALATEWPQIVEQVFGVRFSDVDRLQGKDARDYQEMLSSFRKSVREKAEFALTRAKVKYKEQMAIYDGKRKKYEGKLEQMRKEAMKPPTTEIRYDPVIEENKVWEWKPEFQKWVDTGRVKKEKPKEEKPPDKIPKEKFAIAKAVSAANYRTALTGNERDVNVFQANARLYNITNERNEIAYWQTEGREKTKIIKLPLSAIKDGWTPEKIQAAAKAKVITVEQVLGDLGIIKLPIELMKPAYKKLPISKE